MQSDSSAANFGTEVTAENGRRLTPDLLHALAEELEQRRRERIVRQEEQERMALGDSRQWLKGWIDVTY